MRNASPRIGRKHGFTLIETATATMIMAVVVVAMCQVLAAGTTANQDGTEMTTAVNLAGNVHELALALPLADGGKPIIGTYQTLWDLNGQSFSPAIDGNGRAIGDFAGWTQQVAVQTVDIKNVGTALPDDRSSPTVRLTVTVCHHGRFVHAGSWLITAPESL